MLKIMFSAVGQRDPYGKEKSKGPILGAVEELMPDIMFLFPTCKQPDKRYNSTEENSHATVKEISNLFPDVKVYERPLDLPDPTDYVEIIKQLSQEIENIKSRFSKSKVQYYVALSSGTPQIQAAFLVLVNSNKLKAEVYQTIDPAFVEENEKRTRLVEIHFLEENNQILRARKYFNSINFEAASTELADLGTHTTYMEREKKAEIFCDLVNGYMYWDLYQHKNALDELNKVLPELKRFKFDELYNIVAEQVDTLNKLCNLGEKEDYLNLIDLYHNALRRMKCKQYVDCLSRFKRLYEGTYYYVARTQLGIANPSTRCDHQPQSIKNLVNNKKGYLNHFDISNIYQLQKGTRLVSPDLESQLDQLANQRNSTINNHGMKSVGREDAAKAMKLIEKLLSKVFIDKDIKKYCFSQDRLLEVEELIFSKL